MPTTLIIGGHGKVARQLTRVLRQERKPQHTVVSLIRNATQSSTIESLGGEPLIHSLEDSSVSDLAGVIKKSNASAVVFAAGAGGGNPERTNTVDHLGAIKAFDATAESGVKRFVIVSALDMRDRNKPAPTWYDDADKARSDRIWDVIKPYMEAKLKADRELRTGNGKRDLQYTIVRPGGLSDDAGKGAVAAGKVHTGTMVSREDVARVVAECLDNPGTVGLAFDVVGGDESSAKPIKEAVDAVAQGRVDTFEGYY